MNHLFRVSCSALLVPLLAAQTPARLAEWPPLDTTAKDRLLALVGQFRKPNPQLHSEAHQQLVGLGAGAAPLLMQQVSDRADNTNDHVFGVLDAILGIEHAALLAREVKKPRVELRRYLANRLCRFRAADLAATLEALAKDKDERTAFFGQLGLLGLGRRAALAPVIAYTKTRWTEVGALVGEVLAPGRSHDAGVSVFEFLTTASPGDQMAALRLARYLMTKEQGPLLRTYLQANDHAVKREAINAARVLHGEPPIENLSVFQTIDHAKEWLQKL